MNVRLLRRIAKVIQLTENKGQFNMKVGIATKLQTILSPRSVNYPRKSKSVVPPRTVLLGGHKCSVLIGIAMSERNMTQSGYLGWMVIRRFASFTQISGRRDLVDGGRRHRRPLLELKNSLRVKARCK